MHVVIRLAVTQCASCQYHPCLDRIRLAHRRDILMHEQRPRVYQPSHSNDTKREILLFAVIDDLIRLLLPSICLIPKSASLAHIFGIPRKTV